MLEKLSNINSIKYYGNIVLIKISNLRIEYKRLLDLLRKQGT
jgi:SepF-like predicted cell division protein (DUF552 family)